MVTDELREAIHDAIPPLRAMRGGQLNLGTENRLLIADALIAGPLAETLRLAAIGRWVEQCTIKRPTNSDGSVARPWVQMPDGNHTTYAHVIVGCAIAAAGCVPREPEVAT